MKLYESKKVQSPKLMRRYLPALSITRISFAALPASLKQYLAMSTSCMKWKSKPAPLWHRIVQCPCPSNHWKKLIRQLAPFA
jgi:hypothetical protein